jgi:hypothetical protein
MKLFIGLAFLGILGALAAAGIFMMREGRRGRSGEGRMMRALALRVALSVGLFLLILFAFLMGWIQPTGLPVAR